MSKLFKKILPVALGIAAPFAGPAIGAALGAGSAFAPAVGSAVLGAAGGALGGGGLKSALLGGVTGGLGSYVGTAGNSILGSGSLSAAQRAALGGAISGAGMGGATGGLKGALLGGLSGGVSGYANGGGLNDTMIGRSLGLGSGDVGLNAYNKTIADANLPISKATVSTPATGGLAGQGISQGGGLFSMNNIGNALSGLQSYGTQDEMKKQLLAAQGKAERAFAPYQQTGIQSNQMLAGELASGDLGGDFTPGDLTQDPGYQFRLQEGQKALERSLAARGMGSSGAALKAAQEYGQGLADQTYQNAYNRWLQQQQQRYGMLSGQSGQGLNAAGQLAGVYNDTGNINANSTLAKSNILSSTLSSLLSGNGKQIVGRDQYGNPVYA